MEIIVLTIIIILLSTNMVYAKYISVDRLNSIISIATPIFVVEGKETTKISEINNIGYYEFSIKNFNETQISETGFLYTIEIISKIHESIQFKLYNEGIEIPLENLKTHQLSIVGNDKVEQIYILKIIYDNTKLNDGKDILEEVQVKVRAEQEHI